MNHIYVMLMLNCYSVSFLQRKVVSVVWREYAMKCVALRAELYGDCVPLFQTQK
jgi:hypothetical protein